VETTLCSIGFCQQAEILSKSDQRLLPAGQDEITSELVQMAQEEYDADEYPVREVW
jgi:hypothetical protein